MALHVPEVSSSVLDRVTAAEAIFEAFASRDVETFVANMTEDVFLQPSAFIPGKSEYHGHEEVRSGFAEMFTELDARGEKARIAVSGHYFDGADETKLLTLAYVTVVPSTGDQYGTKIAYLATYRGGRVSELETWLDPDMGLSHLKDPIEVSWIGWR